jgi:hypothetical protein
MSSADSDSDSDSNSDSNSNSNSNLNNQNNKIENYNYLCRNVSDAQTNIFSYFLNDLFDEHTKINSYCNIENKYRHYAYVFKSGNYDSVIVMGHCFVPTYCVEVTVHAEAHALSKLDKINTFRRNVKKHNKIDLLVVRMSKTGKIGYSRPCKDCLDKMSLSRYNINNIYYTANDGLIKMEKFQFMMNSPLTCYSSGDPRRKNLNK